MKVTPLSIEGAWEITPQRAADFDLGRAAITVTWADPDSNAPVTASVALPPVTFSATVPPGAEGIDPFLAATSVAVTARVDGRARPTTEGRYIIAGRMM